MSSRAGNAEGYDRCNGLLAKAESMALCAMAGGLQAMNDEDRSNYMWALSDMLTEARAALKSYAGGQS
ncbi:hypothetical protein [Lysobacter terrae]